MPDPMRSVDQALERIMRDMTEGSVLATNASAELLLDDMKLLTGLEDHSLADLAALDHPYADRHPLGSGPHPDYEVHHQSGDLQEGLAALPAEKRGDQVTAEIHSQSEHTWFLLLGTRKMRPRDFVSAAILRKRSAVGWLYASAFQRIVRGRLVGAFEPEMTLISHEERPAELP